MRVIPFIMSACVAKQQPPPPQMTTQPRTYYCNQTGDKPHSFQVIFPPNGATLDTDYHLGVNQNFLLRIQTDPGWKWGPYGDGYFLYILFRMDSTMNGDGSLMDGPNAETIGMLPGCYRLTGWLVDHNGNSRDCWYRKKSEFCIANRKSESRVEHFYRAMDAQTMYGGPRGVHPFAYTKQPKGGFNIDESTGAHKAHSNFAYVTVIWSDKYVDLVLAWAQSLISSGSVFPRLCMVAADRMNPFLLRALDACCCSLMNVDPIKSPHAATKADNLRIGDWSSYEFALTKLRIFELDRYGYKKIILMDADTLVLQNIDELFFSPSPSFTLRAGSLLGDLPYPELSTGVMVITPSTIEFNNILQTLYTWEKENTEKDILLFIEQDLLDIYYRKKKGKSHLPYNILPMAYNLYPELLDTFPFLSDVKHQPYSRNFVNDTSSTGDYRAGIRTDGVKVVHFWSRYNPIMKRGDKGFHDMVHFHTILRQPQLEEWYHIWWEMHQTALRKAVGHGQINGHLAHCRHAACMKYGERARKGIVVVMGDAFDKGQVKCRHVTGHMAADIVANKNKTECETECPDCDPREFTTIKAARATDLGYT